MPGVVDCLYCTEPVTETRESDLKKVIVSVRGRVCFPATHCLKLILPLLPVLSHGEL